MAFLLIISSVGVHAVYSAESADIPEEIIVLQHGIRPLQFPVDLGAVDPEHAVGRRNRLPPGCPCARFTPRRAYRRRELTPFGRGVQKNAIWCKITGYLSPQTTEIGSKGR